MKAASLRLLHVAAWHCHRRTLNQHLVTADTESSTPPKGPQMSSTTAPHASILFRLGRRRSRPAEPDPADLGTAFGLDQSLAREEEEAAAAAAAPARGDWLQRLRLKPAR